ncbi:hypothetical protein B7494_g8511 [Chlorociboria aeruginascens]|nr:hypothetical protein B7494_g8511 [Chlorociboria aeruginascens]
MISSNLFNESIPLSGANENSDSDYILQSPRTKRRCRRPSLPPALPTVFKMLLSVLLSFILGAAISMVLTAQINQRKQDTDLIRQCAMRMSHYSPVLNEVDQEYSTTYFNGSFMQEMIYRRPASPEVDAAWQALGIEYRPSVIPKEEGKASGFSKHHVQRAKKYGGGYFVQVEGLHHLHCLNMVRKSLYYNYDYYKATGDYAFDNDEVIVKFHVYTGVLGQVWTQQVNTKYPQAFLDFNIQHFCKNYDTVRRWAEAYQVLPNEELPDTYVAPPEENDVLPYIPK